MARRTKAVMIAAEGRDKAKTFLVTEMPALQAERWATRALLAFARSGRDDLPEDIKAGGAAGLMAVGLKALTTMDFEEAGPLLDEMLACVTFVPDLSRTDQMTKQPITRPVMWDDDVEEPMTILQLRSEVIEVHLGFSIAAFLSDLGAKAKAALSNTSDTSTSLSPSAT